MEIPGNDEIILTFVNGSMTKAADTEAEAYVAHVDVMIFDASENMVYHERVMNTGAGSFALDAARSEFGSGTEYYVYLIANSTAASADFEYLENLEDLKDMVQQDDEIMFANVGTTIHHFLMDAVAYTGDTEPQTPGTVVLNDGVVSHSTYLNAVFRRAAAKVQVIINKGTAIEFAPAEDRGTAGYYMRNCPSSTTLIDAYDINPVLVTGTPAPQNANFLWTDEKITLVAYAYEYEWVHQSIQDKETSLVVNIPMLAGGNLSTNNWYKVPVSQTNSFERNHLYTVEVTINALGSSSMDNPLELDDVAYNVIDWDNVAVNVGNALGAEYLQLNTNHVDMYNVNIDDSTLKFASSSEIPADGITLLEAYYYDYLDVKQSVSNLAISATATSGVLNGNITINSPFVAMSLEERQEAISNLTIPQLTMSEPQEPAGKPTEVENPGDTQPADPNTKEVLDQIAEQYSINGWWWSVKVSWSKNNNNEVVFTDDSAWSNASEEAQAEYERLLQIYNNYDSMKEQYDAYLAELDAWKAANSDYFTELAKYEDLYAKYQLELKAYNEAVAEINNSDEDTHENAIRYMTFEVRNTSGQTATFTVAQYPTIYITNERGHYSYRSDFGDTYYGHKGNPNYSGVNWVDGNWDYDDEASNSYFFGSKVATGSENSYSINYSYYNGNSTNTTVTNISGLNNPRMYHVNVTATSTQYVVAIPRLDGGYTESSEDNSKLVSPSFMIASQLGATQTPSGGFEQAKRHCEQYIEVTAIDYDGDGKVEIYDDWRLPTAAEIDIIIQHQDISDAMDEVLTGQAYYCSWNGIDNNGNTIYLKSTGKTGGQNAVRCVRDAY